MVSIATPEPQQRGARVHGARVHGARIDVEQVSHWFAQRAAKGAKAANGTKSAGVTPVVAGGTLADRIRALQSHASRARQTG